MLDLNYRLLLEVKPLVQRLVAGRVVGRRLVREHPAQRYAAPRGRYKHTPNTHSCFCLRVVTTGSRRELCRVSLIALAVQKGIVETPGPGICMGVWRGHGVFLRCG